MGPTDATTSRATTRRRIWRGALFGVAALIASAVGFWFLWGRTALDSGAAGPNTPTSADPRRSYAGPFVNVDPDVAFVGDAACARCHRDLVTSYRRTAMGRSLAPVATNADTQRYDAAAHNPFIALRSRFEVRRDGKRVLHHQTRLDAAGKPIYEQTQEAHYLLGSGTRGFSYLTERDGFLFQTPISWFAQKQIWDHSPGFGPDWHTGRPVGELCLSCHTNRVVSVSGSANRYEQPIFQGHAIGCERCHGPGSKHVAAPGEFDAHGLDPTIVNPRHLEPALREAICQQCHLAGATRVARRGFSPNDFRPALPLQSVLRVFVLDEPGETARAVSHVEQMHLSQCFRASSGADKLGCTSCHDPHTNVPAERRIAHYRDRCLQCHQTRGCHLPVAERRVRSPQDSCIDCHMPRTPTADIAHTAGTDHRITRTGVPPAPAWPRPGAPRTLLDFHGGRLNPDDPEQMRDGALALASLAQERGEPATSAVPLLRAAVRHFPDDAEARHSLGTLELLQGRAGPALEQFQAILDRNPVHERALAGAAAALTALGRKDEAVARWRRAVAANPWAPNYRAELATLLSQQGVWSECKVQAEAWVRTAPEDVSARKLLIRCLHRAGAHAEARAELTRVIALQPKRRSELQTWFADVAR